VDRVLGVLQLNVVIRTAAYHKVEECEKQPVQSLAVNATAPRNLALACRQNNAVLVHFSTDYVFDGGERRPYTESDLPRPLNVYGISKLAGEHMVRLTWERHFVIRTCGLYDVAGSSGRGGNFVETMLILRPKLEETRRLIGNNDLWIGAQAMALDVTLAANDVPS
jgi:dTDP-4-dehydrorhamnose reductase